MKQKRGLLLILVLIIMMTMQIAFATDCIPCADGRCLAPNPNGPIYSGTCVVANDNSQPKLIEIDVNSANNNINPVVWQIDSLTISKGVTLHFFNSQLQSISPSSYGGESCGYYDGDCLGGNSGQSTPPYAIYDTSGFGDGGHGEDGNRDGGDGGGGGAGGLMFQIGGAGADGGHAYEGSFSCAHSGLSGGVINTKVGANINLITNNLVLNGNISVSGFDGGNGTNGGSSGCNGGGGGGGAGGSGAGKINLFVKTTMSDESDEGYIVANGGNGGNGGKGEDENGKNTNDDGCFGGGGGGGQGGIITYQIIPGISTPYALNTKADGGKGGIQGEKSHCTSDMAAIFNGMAGKGGNSLSDVTEMDPDGEGPLILNLLNCNDGIDNDKDGLIDMSDYDCVHEKSWDATIQENFNPVQGINGYNQSAINGTDLACGDDTGKCEIAKNINGVCVFKSGHPDGSLCKTSFFPGTTQGRGCLANPSNPIPMPAYCIEKYVSSTAGTICEYNANYICSSFNSSNCAFSNVCTWLNSGSNCAQHTNAECKNDASCVLSSITPGTSDLGSLTKDNSYLCLDSIKIDNSGDSHIWDPTGGTYSWFDATGSSSSKFDFLPFDEFTIFQADNTQFISNGEKWYWCNASNNVNYGANAMKEYGTFSLSAASNVFACSFAFETMISKDISDFNVRECTDTVNNCKSECNDLGEDCEAFCSNKEFRSGKFIEDCKNVCYIKGDAAYTPLGQRLDLIESDNTIPDVFNLGRLEAGKVNQDFCKYFEDLCMDETLPVGSCSDIHKNLGFTYSTPELKLCQESEYCDGGRLFPSNDTSGKCCLGSNSKCKTFEIKDCKALGGVVNSGCETCKCTGIEIKDTAGSTDSCCLYGQWVDASQVLLNTNNSFMCYAQNDNSYIQECCGLYGCSNQNNMLNEWTISSENMYATAGVPLHSLVSYDVITAEGNLSRDAMRYTGIITGVQTYLDIMVFNKKIDWGTFEYLEFDMLKNIDLSSTLVLADSNGVSCYFSIENNEAMHRGTGKWSHIAINLSKPIRGDAGTLTACNLTTIFNISEIKEVSIIINGDQPGYDGKINFAVDNFYLGTKETLVNSENRFCSGDWGVWVKNLDGPVSSPSGDKGFIGLPAPGIIAYGPYMSACNGIVSFDWTGNVCCGDDTSKGSYGEFWKDSNGACWNGTTVLEDKTVANAIGISSSDSDWNSKYSNDTRSLLFHNGELWSCNKSISNFNEYKISYSGTGGSVSIDSSINSQIQEPYTIKGSWMCQEGEGWVELDKVNRVMFMARVLRAMGEKKIADSAPGYTLMCGDYTKVSNYVSVLTDPEYASEGAGTLTDYACVLKSGANDLRTERTTDGTNVVFDGFSVVGLEIKSLDTPFNEYEEKVLSRYILLNLNSSQYTCNDAPSDVTSDTFFYECGIDAENDLRVYYNKPLNLILISGSDTSLVTDFGSNYGFTSGTSGTFFSNVWNGFKNLFSNLFGQIGSESTNIASLDQKPNTRDFYISNQGDKAIVGVLEENGEGGYFLKVEYTNFSSNVRMLRDAIEHNYPNSKAIYESNNFTQSIFVNIPADTDVADWRLMTSILRINIGVPPTVPTKFAKEMYPSCLDSDGGFNMTVYGVASDGITSTTDYCYNSETIYESVCSIYTDIPIYSTMGCPTGTVCSNGACS